jgi:hypothetical protein
MILNGTQPGFSFYVTGTGVDDSLVITTTGIVGGLSVSLPAAALLWRDAAFIERHGPRRGYGCCDVRDPLDDVKKKIILKTPAEVEARTGARGALGLTVADGLATIEADAATGLELPCLRIAQGAAAPVAVRIEAAQADGGVVNVGQLAAGRRVGGVAMVVPVRGPT